MVILKTPLRKMHSGVETWSFINGFVILEGSVDANYIAEA